MLTPKQEAGMEDGMQDVMGLYAALRGAGSIMAYQQAGATNFARIASLGGSIKNPALMTNEDRACLGLPPIINQSALRSY